MTDELNPLNNDTAPATDAVELPAEVAITQSSHPAVTTVADRLTTLETQVEEIITIVTSLIGAVNALISDVKTFNVFKFGKDISTVVADVSELKSKIGSL